MGNPLVPALARQPHKARLDDDAPVPEERFVSPDAKQPTDAGTAPIAMAGKTAMSLPSRASAARQIGGRDHRSEEHTSELQSLMRISYAVFCLKKKTKHTNHNSTSTHQRPCEQTNNSPAV